MKDQKAKAAHDIGASWMKWLFEWGTMNEDGSWTMPKEKVDRWKRQMTTEYQDLSESEKESDRKVAKEYMNFKK